jgi:cytoskeleton protein RodZ
MPEIGETLRETRMRRRVDMTEVETATKIRAKYLRALENEEWDLLPGPTFVKTFLRTYADYLELDSRLLVEEYRQRYERPSTQDLTPFAAGRRGRGRRRRARVAALGPVLVMGAGVVLLLAIFYVLGRFGDDDDPGEPNRTQQPQVTAEPSDPGSGAGGRSRERERPSETQRRPRRVNLRLVASGDVYVCLIDASGRQVVDEETLTAGTRTRVFRSQSFRANFGNSGVRMLVGDRSYRVAESSDPVGYAITPGRAPRRLSADARPDCSS